MGEAISYREAAYPKNQVMVIFRIVLSQRLTVAFSKKLLNEGKLKFGSPSPPLPPSISQVAPVRPSVLFILFNTKLLNNSSWISRNLRKHTFFIYIRMKEKNGRESFCLIIFTNPVKYLMFRFLVSMKGQFFFLFLFKFNHYFTPKRE